MFSLNPREMLFIVAILVATVLGMAVKHWRDARREMPAHPVAASIQKAPDSGKP